MAKLIKQRGRMPVISDGSLNYSASFDDGGNFKEAHIGLSPFNYLGEKYHALLIDPREARAMIIYLAQVTNRKFTDKLDVRKAKQIILDFAETLEG
jgi:hypothetical protein